MLKLSPELAEASLHSERAARAVLTRRNLFAAGAALAAGSAFSFAAPAGTGYWVVETGPIGQAFTIYVAGVRIGKGQLVKLASGKLADRIVLDDDVADQIRQQRDYVFPADGEDLTGIGAFAPTPTVELSMGEIRRRA